MFFRRPINQRLKHILLLFLLFGSLLGASQNNIPTGSWRTHYSFNTAISITQSEQEVYVASNTGLFIFNKEDGSIKSITSLNGLSETGISLIGYNQSTSTLLISYENGQLDLLANNVISSITDIKLADNLPSKISYHMFEDGDFTYLSTDFGLLKINTKTQLIQESYLNLSSTGNNLKIFASTIYNDSLFLATETGLMAGSLSENLKDFSKWKRFDINTGITQEQANIIGLHQNKPITANTSQGLLHYNNGSWQPLNLLIGNNFTSIDSPIKTLITASDSVYLLENFVLSTIVSDKIIKAKDAILEGNNYWVADGNNGLVSVSTNKSESFYPNGPYFNEIKKLVSVDNKIFALPPFKQNNGLPLKNNNGFSVFEEGFWTNFNSTGYPQTKPTPTFLDITGVTSQKRGVFTFSSYGYGLLNWTDESFTIINDDNSPLVNTSPPDKNVLIADIDSRNNNLWVLNNNTAVSLHKLNTDNQWTSLTPNSLVANATQIISTPWGDQWISISSTVGGGIIVLNQDGQEVILKKSGLGTIPSNSINQLLIDKDDKIWIATAKGVVYYLSPYHILEDPTQEAITPIINSNLLFSNENVNCLAVDGGNRIWMGTNKGAWLFANDGTELIEHFTSENSPLLSNVVLNIAINNLTAEVFINTNKGLISYRGSGSITGTYKTPKIFPNPVNPGFTGVVTIEGVPSNSLVKITDSSGRLITTIKANGNTAIWDMNNVYANEVSTGVYFIFIANEDGSTTQFGKVAIIK